MRRRATPTRRSRSFRPWRRCGLYRAAAAVRNEVTGATLKEIYWEIDNLRAGRLTPEELADAKQYSRGLFVIQNATQSGFAQTLNTVNTFGLPKDYPETFQRQISQPSAEAIKTGGADDARFGKTRWWSSSATTAKVKDQLGAVCQHHVPRFERQADPRAEIAFAPQGVPRCAQL